MLADLALPRATARPTRKPTGKDPSFPEPHPATPKKHRRRAPAPVAAQTSCPKKTFVHDVCNRSLRRRVLRHLQDRPTNVPPEKSSGMTFENRPTFPTAQNPARPASYGSATPTAASRLGRFGHTGPPMAGAGVMPASCGPRGLEDIELGSDAVEQFLRRDAERRGDFQNVFDARVSLSTFDPTDVASMESTDLS